MGDLWIAEESVQINQGLAYRDDQYSIKLVIFSEDQLLPVTISTLF